MLKHLFRRCIHSVRRSIRSKLIITMVLLAVLPIIAITALAAENSRASMESEVINTNLSNLKWTGIYLGEQFSQLNNLIYTIQVSPVLTEYLGDREQDDLSSRLDEQRKIFEILNSVYYSAGNHVVGIGLYVHETSTLFMIDSMENNVRTLAAPPVVYGDLVRQNKDFIIDTTGDDPEKFRLIRSINRFENQERLGAITLEIRWSAFNQTLELLGGTEKQRVLIAGNDGKVLYSPSIESALSKEAVERLTAAGPGPGYFRTPQEYVFYNTVDPLGLRLVKIIPKREIDQTAIATMTYGLLVGTVSAALSVLLAVFLAWRTARPIVKLVQSLQGIDLIDERKVLPARSGRTDEIGLLENNLHDMAIRIRSHIQYEYKINLEKRTAELKALQSQINPHFLQNTLQLIGGMIFAHKPADSYEVIRSLSEMFRYIVREPDHLASLQAELKHLQHYMHIQQKRFQGRLQYTLDVEEETLQSELPKLSLQPIAENAFAHGLESRPENWKLNVSIKRSGTGVLIRISDNGAGMEPDRLAKLRSKLASDADGSGTGGIWMSGKSIGLINVAARIRMHFGPAYGISINSEPGKGTDVCICVPNESRGAAE
ncbi:sensor histidine kinase [Paenibacillus sp. P96]|uniref:histidine kinase n=1 Tax=Paenibacillus zeirhizosphaerae TaxID=2987519 RepID=A0ABT9FRJ6_9BACL|nr:histidine kinase [Paenibacillus sp. P96]MDP4097151.1 sensor histidine kinase [Paenibacillus sp. P96]